ncbi:T-complex protein 11-domain-containing protein [Chytriomyces sp. MP71]|nr:T-complex protein 11-domain-containing protein [Chytriomyces sp. MP71]
MEQDRKTGFYVIDALPLKKSSGKPHHLAERIQKRRSTSQVSSSTSSGSLSRPGPSTAASASTFARNASQSNAAFVEARRLKLATRNRHVSAVMASHRLRKGEKGDAADEVGRQKILDTLERAERKRAILIEHQVKSNAFKVARAKQIAAQQQKKSTERNESLRKNLEDRLRASEARRRILQSIPRSRLLDPMEIVALHKNVDEQDEARIQDASALAIQTWWRLKGANRAIIIWTSCDLSLKRAKAVTFEKLIRIVQSKLVIKGATSVISFLKKFVGMLPNDPKTNWKNPARVFLSLYMIVAHTSEIMPTMGEEEQAVKRVAAELVTKFEAWIAAHTAPHKTFSVQSTTDLLMTWISYYNQFEAWKERDTMKLVDGLIGHYLELENLWLSVKDQIDADLQWKPRVEEQQKQIFGRLSKFGDKAMQRFMTARRELHEQFGLIDDDEEDAGDLSEGGRTGGQMSVDESSGDESTRGKGITIPGSGRSAHRVMASRSVSPSTSMLATSPQRFPGRVSQSRSSFTDSVSRPNAITPQPVPRRPSSAMSVSSGSRPSSPAGDVILPQKLGVVTPRAQDLTGPVSSERLGALSSTPGFGDVLTNEKLAHELTLDPEFALKKPEQSELEKRVKEAARKAFFAQVTAELKNDNFEGHVPEFITDFKKQLMSMVSEKGKIAAEIDEKLDVEFITHQIKHKSANLPAILLYIASKMAQLCAPLRDVSIRAINTTIRDAKDAVALVPVIDSMFQVLDEMKLDLANYRLQTLRPHLKTQAVEYEKSKFRESLAAYTKQQGTSTDPTTSQLLPRTREWLNKTVESKAATARERNPENIDLPENRPRYTDILHDALLSLVFGNTAVAPASIPETLVMDAQRVFGFQNEGQRVVVVAVLLMLVQNIVIEGRGDKAFLTSLKDRLFVLLKDPEGLSLDNLVLEIISQCNVQVLEKKRARLLSVGQEANANAVTEGLDVTRKGLIQNMVEKTLSTKDPVFGLLRRRVQNAIKSHVVSGMFKREGLDKAGLDVIRTELEAFSYRVAIWVRYNGEVYGEWYDDILKELLP